MISAYWGIADTQTVHIAGVELFNFIDNDCLRAIDCHKQQELTLLLGKY